MIKYKTFFLLSTLCLASVKPLLCWSESNLIKLSQQQIDNLGIKLGKLEPAAHVPLFSAPAKVVVPPAHEFVVSTSQAGVIVKMNVAVGDKVNQGELIAVVNSPDLLTLQGNYLKAASALQLATANYQRDKKLRKEGIISGRSEQEAYSAYNSAVIEVNQAKQLLKIAGMSAADLKQLDQAGKLTSQLAIRSPIGGRVIERMAATGSRVDNLAPLYRIANFDQLWLEINIPQDHINDLNVGDRVQIEHDSAEAVIKVLGQNVNPENQTIPARAIMTTATASIRVGQKVTIHAVQANDNINYILPDTAIAHNTGKAYIFVHNKDGFKVNEISILGKQGGNSVITGNLIGDEEIAVNNAVTLKANWLGLGSDE